jgi:transcriptional regulator with XRE-family HTH domain
MTLPDTASLTGRALAEIRAELGRQNLTRVDLANRLGVERNWVHYRLAGETSLRLVDVERIAEALHVPVGRFLPTATTPAGG